MDVAKDSPQITLFAARVDDHPHIVGMLPKLVRKQNARNRHAKPYSKTLPAAFWVRVINRRKFSW